MRNHKLLSHQIVTLIEGLRSLSTFSCIVYESPELRVVDAKSLAFGARGGSADDATGRSVSVVYSRRMEFVTTPHLSQTEVYLSGRPLSWTESDQTVSLSASDAVLDHSVLHMPVHRTMAKLVKQFLHQRKAERQQQSPSSSIAVIGAGCCALPSHLLSVPALAGTSVSVVEPSSEVLDVAQRYFGAQFSSGDASAPGSGMQSYCIDGESFLRTHSDRRFDVIVVDAFAQSAPAIVSSPEAQDGETEQARYAPPESLLQCWTELHAALGPYEAGKSGGLLLVNVYGPASWIDNVQRTATDRGLFCAPVLVEPAAVDVRDAPGTQDRNVVLATMRVEDGEVFAELPLRR